MEPSHDNVHQEEQQQTTPVNPREIPPVTIRLSPVLPPGYCFRPTDQELILEYLMKKANNEPIPIPIPIANMNETDFRCNNPMALIESSKIGDNWYFFTPRERKYLTGKWANRRGDIGYWKASGVDKPVEFEGRTIGFKKALRFFLGPNLQGRRTDWMMNEFSLNQRPKTSALDMRMYDDWVLCQIYQVQPFVSDFDNYNPVDDDLESNASTSGDEFEDDRD